MADGALLSALELRPDGPEEEFERWMSVMRRLSPEDPGSVDGVRALLRPTANPRRGFVWMSGDRPVGVSTVMHAREPDDRWYASVLLDEEAAGSALDVALDHACGLARSVGATRMQFTVRPRRRVHLEALLSRGGQLVERMVMLERILTPADAGGEVARDSVLGRRLVRLVDRPDLQAEWHAADAGFTADIPGETGDAGTLEEWLGYIEATPRVDRALMWALLDDDGAIEAIAHLERHSIDPETLEIAMLGVRRESRRSGLARAIKRWLHATAWDLGARRLETLNHAGNHAMEELNASLGYRLHDELLTYELVL